MRLKAFMLLCFITVYSCNSSKKSLSFSEQSAVKPATSLATITIKGMACQAGCADAIQENLLKIEGVEKAVVSYEEANAIVTFNTTKTSTTVITKTITDTKVKDYIYTIKNIEIKNL
ncbi:heavy metal-associated domain-containing protein [Maribacter sp.]|uniref:heavy-metal-associated domain-containing protein n=1 Tax=Maribacter sp. TaxID=1897614 RepID=UPI0025BB92B5|nr:heavy metal-associated domain-containing protein [Maribacter sp.]